MITAADIETGRALRTARLHAVQAQHGIEDALRVARDNQKDLSIEALIAVEHLRKAVACIDRAEEGTT